MTTTSLSDAFLDPLEAKNHHVAVNRIWLKLSKVQAVQISGQYLDWLTIYKAKRVQFWSFWSLLVTVQYNYTEIDPHLKKLLPSLLLNILTKLRKFEKIDPHLMKLSHSLSLKTNFVGLLNDLVNTFLALLQKVVTFRLIFRPPRGKKPSCSSKPHLIEIVQRTTCPNLRAISCLVNDL